VVCLDLGARKLAYLTMREYTRSGPVCLGALILIAGAIIALLPSIDVAYAFFGENTMLYGAIIAVVGLLLIIVGFAFTKKKRDSVLEPVRVSLTFELFLSFFFNLTENSLISEICFIQQMLICDQASY